MDIKKALTALLFTTIIIIVVISTYNKHVIEEEDSSGVSLFFLVWISHVEQRSQHSELSVKGSQCLVKEKDIG